MAKYDDDDDNDVPMRRKELSGLDAFFGNTNTVLLVLFACCCGLIALIVSLIGLNTCTDEKAKANAKLVMIISGIMVVLNVIATILQILAGAAGGFK